MNHTDFKIGEEFYASAGFKWRCTDIGTRTISAIMLDPEKDESWFIGPPYSVEEVIFDEYDMESCYTNSTAELIDRVEKLKNQFHPNFESKDVLTMIKDKHFLSRNDYPRKRLFKKDRIDNSGNILHPYTALQNNNIWYIKAFDIFSKTYQIIEEDVFVKFPIATEEDMKQQYIKYKKNLL